MALAIAAEPMRATLRSTTLVNSSKTTTPVPLAPWGRGVRGEGFVAAPSALARSQRNFSPLLSTAYGLIHDGGELKPTAVSRPVICLIGSRPKQSTTAQSAGQSPA